MAWTFQQEKAIYTRGQNIIVSAGAGSGKTAVLSERILDYCLKGNDIRKVLVLTFTNAAAMEMKERIRKKLIENHLEEQASAIDSAFITTFDAYSLALVKKYYFKLGLERDITIIDQALLSVQKTQLLDGLFTELYESKDKRFFSLLRKYAKQDDKNMKEIVLLLLGRLELIVDDTAYCETYEQTYYSEDFICGLVQEYEQLTLSKLKEIEVALNQLLEIAATDIASSKLYDQVLAVQQSLKSVQGYEQAYVVLQGLELPRVAPKADSFVKEHKKACTDMIKAIKEEYFSKYIFLKDMETELYSIKEDILYFLELSKTLGERLFEYKYSLMQFDYIDIAKMAIRLVTQFEDVHDEVSFQLNEILIDEYQDTSDLQETFIQAISRDNCYMVGDIKQSIYRFRNANPYIFKQKYEQYAKNDQGLKIDLTYNFRSRKEVLNNINEIFNVLMTDDCGDANYSLEHQMQYGLKKYEELEQNYNFSMNVLSYESIEDFTDEEVEAFICGKKIQALLQENVKCLKSVGYQKLCYNDIAILIDKTKSFTTFKKIFEYLGIPLSVEADMDLNASILPKLFANMLLMLSHFKRNERGVAFNHAIASIARSFLFECSDETIYLILQANQEHPILDIFKELSYSAGNVSYESLFHLLCNKLSIYEKLPKIGDVENSLVVLDYIYNLFQTISKAGMNLERASRFFADVFDQGIALKYKLPNSSGNSVHIMTIHKSKGLEYPICFFPMLGSAFNKADLKQNFGLSLRYGIYIPFASEGSSNTIVKPLVSEEIRKSDISEKVRLFYVALTRAREKIFLISNEKEYNPNVLTQGNYGCFNHMVRSLNFVRSYYEKVDTSALELTKNYKLTKSMHQLPKGELLTYDTPSFESALISKKHISKELKELITEPLQSALERGLEFHECLEVLDFQNPNVDELPVSEEIKVTLKKCLAHPVFKSIQFAKTYHEHEFYFEAEDMSYHGIIDFFAEYEDHIDIIDYKLSSIDSAAYLNQLAIYKRYIMSVSTKPVDCYLLSILRQEIKKVE